MFTGIVQTQGEIVAKEASDGDARFRVRVPESSMSDMAQGESVALNGVCLTVERYGKSWYTCYASAETLRLTTLGALGPGACVNLERALAMGDRLGGHLVSGHVDGVATVRSVTPVGQSRIVELSFPPILASGVIPKGSVALDGVSLTINECGPDSLRVNVIPETWNATILHAWKPGVRVNMETDLIGKYVARLCVPWQGSPRQESGGLSMEFLREHGF